MPHVHVHLVPIKRPAGAETTIEEGEDDTPHPHSEHSGIYNGVNGDAVIISLYFTRYGRRSGRIKRGEGDNEARTR